MKGDRERYLEAGMDDYVSKPIEPAHLSAAIARQTGIAAAESAAAADPGTAPANAPGTQGAGLSAELDAMFDALELPSSG